MELTEAQMKRMTKENADADLGERSLASLSARSKCGSKVVEKVVTIEHGHEIPPMRRMTGHGSFA